MAKYEWDIYDTSVLNSSLISQLVCSLRSLRIKFYSESWSVYQQCVCSVLSGRCGCRISVCGRDQQEWTASPLFLCSQCHCTVPSEADEHVVNISIPNTLACMWMSRGCSVANSIKILIFQWTIFMNEQMDFTIKQTAKVIIRQ